MLWEGEPDVTHRKSNLKILKYKNFVHKLVVLSIKKNTLPLISLQFRTILLRYKPVWYWEENMDRQVEKPYGLKFLSAVPSKITM